MLTRTHVCIIKCTQARGGGTRRYAVFLFLSSSCADATIQVAVERKTPGTTIIPVIFSSDQTQVTLFRNKAAYPVYLTIGNIPKHLRRQPSRHAYILVAYLPTTKLEHIQVKAARRRATGNLFHACMSCVTKPLRKPGRVGADMTSGDGVTRHGHTIYALTVADYQEQILVVGVYKGDCPVCPAKKDELDDDEDIDIRDMGAVLDAIAKANNPDPRVYAEACRMAGIKPIVGLFYRSLPYSHIFKSIAPDILHQLYQGVIKHLMAWLKAAVDPAEINARCRRLPPNHHIRLFMAGITSLSRLTGQEHGDICRILLGLIVDLRLANGFSARCLVAAVRAILDCLYLAQYPLHSTATLQLLQDAIDRFEANKQIFIDLGICQHFNINKFHFLKRHYVSAIKLYGTTDNYNTEYTEQLHCDLAKDAYRSTNRKDEYPQMATWLIRKEKVHHHERFVAWKTAGQPPPQQWTLSVAARDFPRIKFTKYPTRRAVCLDELKDLYGATLIRESLANFFIKLQHPNYSRHQVETAADGWDAPFRTLAVYHKIRFHHWDEQGYTGVGGVSDCIHVQPDRTNKQGSTIPGQFDTVIFKDLESANQDGNGVNGEHLSTDAPLPNSSLCEACGWVASVLSFQSLTTSSDVHSQPQECRVILHTLNHFPRSDSARKDITVCTK